MTHKFLQTQFKLYWWFFDSRMETIEIQDDKTFLKHEVNVKEFHNLEDLEAGVLDLIKNTKENFSMLYYPKPGERVEKWICTKHN